jgi:hypothetical protein
MSEVNIQEVSQRYFDFIDRILHHFAGDKFKDEIRMAKSQFFDNAGILDEKSPNFELRMNQFFDWYFFTRDLEGLGQTPLDSFHVARELRFTMEDMALIEDLRAHRHGLFEFIKIKGSDVYIKDLLKNEKMIVQQSPWIFGFESDEIFEARLIPYRGGNQNSGDANRKDKFWIFTKGFCFHPKEARKFILSEVKRHRKDPDLNPEGMMLRLLRMRYKFERYRHVKVDIIYSNDSKVGNSIV